MSRESKKEYEKKYHAEVRKPKLQVLNKTTNCTCLTCGNSFVRTKGVRQIYCSKPCQSKAGFKKKMQNPQYKLRHNLRSRLRKTIHNRTHGLSPVRHLGCSIAELKANLESKFKDGMTWENYGEWHIDHIKPLADFDLTNEEEFKEACNHTNLQPLWGKENLKKGSNVL